MIHLFHLLLCPFSFGGIDFLSSYNFTCHYSWLANWPSLLFVLSFTSQLLFLKTTETHINKKNTEDGIYANTCFKLCFLTNIKFCASDTPIKKYQTTTRTKIVRQKFLRCPTVAPLIPRMHPSKFNLELPFILQKEEVGNNGISAFNFLRQCPTVLSY